MPLLGDNVPNTKRTALVSTEKDNFSISVAENTFTFQETTL